jgi:hypothetical protein
LLTCWWIFLTQTRCLKQVMLDWTEIVDECEYVPDVERGMNCSRRKVSRIQWRSYRRNTYCILLSGLLLNATSTFPVIEQAERHIISKKLRKGPDFAEQKMADWSGKRRRNEATRSYSTPKITASSTSARIAPTTSAIYLKASPKRSNRNTARFHQTSCKILLQIYECVSAR